MWHMNDPDLWWWLVITFGMVVFWSLVIYGAVWLSRGARAPAASAEPPTGTESPQQTLKRRLAAGDIDVEEYERLRAVLDEDRAEAPLAPALL